MNAIGRQWTMLAATLAMLTAAPFAVAETLQEAWTRALAQDRGLAAVRSHAEAAGLDAAAARAQRLAVPLAK